MPADNSNGRWLLLAASGKGTRSGLNINKAFFPVDGICPIVRCLIAFRGYVEGAVICIGKSDADELAKIKPVVDLIMPYKIAYGGETRRDSVRNGLDALPDDCGFVAIHDAARPFVTGGLIERVFEAAEESGAAIPAIGVTDTTIDIDDGVSYLIRDKLRSVQTPQIFLTPIIKEAHCAASDSDKYTDDASIVIACGHPVTVVEGEQTNIKLTYAYQFDNSFAKTDTHCAPLLVGFGYDVHQLVPDRDLVLCGVYVPHTLGLLGHSDADVATHALMDAILGGAAMGDIGKHFPDSDPAYSGIYSIELLRRVISIVEARGYNIVNVDITIAAERPKIAKYIEDMRQNLANAMHIDVNYISVKATTTERLGFVGREEGIAAFAVCSLTNLSGDKQ
jgi:2-C-methyl-D-erythritol 4-phosphate cytidylyltransferase/2-C-methyl-D-erythritol 2,4-cyclodiphosphate synthase